MIKYVIYFLFIWNVGLFVFAQGLGPLLRAPQVILHAFFGNTTKQQAVKKRPTVKKHDASKIRFQLDQQAEDLRRMEEQNRVRNQQIQQQVDGQKAFQLAAKDRLASQRLQAQRLREQQSQNIADTQARYRDMMQTRKRY